MNKLLALLAFGALLGLLYFITPHIADLIGRSIDQTLDQRKGEVERIIRDRQENDKSEIALLRGGDGKRRGF